MQGGGAGIRCGAESAVGALVEDRLLAEGVGLCNDAVVWGEVGRPRLRYRTCADASFGMARAWWRSGAFGVDGVHHFFQEGQTVVLFLILIFGEAGNELDPELDGIYWLVVRSVSNCP